MLSSGEFPTNPSSSLAWAGILSSGGFPTISSSSLAWADTLSSDGSATKSEMIKKQEENNLFYLQIKIPITTSFFWITQIARRQCN